MCDVPSLLAALNSGVKAKASVYLDFPYAYSISALDPPSPSRPPPPLIS